MFAKLFDSAEHGQILVKADTDTNCKPEIRFYFEPKDYGVCSMALTYTDTDDGFDKRDSAFEKIDCAFAEKLVGETKSKIGV